MKTLRQYLTKEEYEAITGKTAGANFDSQLIQAEAIIDSYVGFHDKFYPQEIIGQAQEATQNTLKLEAKHATISYADFYKNCVIEIVRGTGVGQKKAITASETNGQITIDENWDTNKTPDTTSYYRIFQLGKFPRKQDIRFDSGVQIYFKSIPEEVKTAVAHQVAYIEEMGSAFFETNKSDMQSENIGDYGYSMGSSGSGSSANQLVSPMARQDLRGFVCRIGKIV